MWCVCVMVWLRAVCWCGLKMVGVFGCGVRVWLRVVCGVVWCGGVRMSACVKCVFGWKLLFIHFHFLFFFFLAVCVMWIPPWFCVMAFSFSLIVYLSLHSGMHSSADSHPPNSTPLQVLHAVLLVHQLLPCFTLAKLTFSFLMLSLFFPCSTIPWIQYKRISKKDNHMCPLYLPLYRSIIIILTIIIGIINCTFPSTPQGWGEGLEKAGAPGKGAGGKGRARVGAAIKGKFYQSYTWWIVKEGRRRGS